MNNKDSLWLTPQVPVSSGLRTGQSPARLTTPLQAIAGIGPDPDRLPRGQDVVSGIHVAVVHARATGFLDQVLAATAAYSDHQPWMLADAIEVGDRSAQNLPS